MNSLNKDKLTQFKNWLESIVAEFTIDRQDFYFRRFYEPVLSMIDTPTRAVFEDTGSPRRDLYTYIELNLFFVDIGQKELYFIWKGSHHSWTGTGYAFYVDTVYPDPSGLEKIYDWKCETCSCYNDLITTGWCSGKYKGVKRKIYGS